MANIPAVFGKKLYPAESQMNSETGLVVVRGSFETNGTSAVTNVRGNGFGVNRTGVGVFDLTFGNPYPMMVACQVSVQGDTANTLDVLDAQVGTYNASTGVLEIFTRSIAGNSAIDAAAYRTGETVTTNAHTAAEAGYIVGPILGDTTLITSVLQSGTPGASACTVTYAAGVPTLTFAAGDSFSTCDYLLIPTAGTGISALTDGDGPRVNFTAVFQRRTSLPVTHTS